MIKPAFYFPPHTIEIENGEFALNNTDFFELELEKISQALPNNFTLLPPYPNPFNPNTTIQFYCNDLEDFNLSIYDVNGKKIESIFSNISPNIGLNKINWYPKNYSSGLYFILLETKSDFYSQKLIFLK